MLLGLGLSAVGQDVPRGIYFGDKQVVAKFNDVVDIFGDNKALYDPEMNMLLLRDGFKYASWRWPRTGAHIPPAAWR